MNTNVNPGILYGVGVDICDIRRIEKALARHGQRFVSRILGPEERVTYEKRYSLCKRRGVRYLATRFSAKEAFAKAVGLGIHSPMSWPLVQILNLPGGKPHIVLSGKLKSWCDEKISCFSVSLSDESDYAISYVAAERIKNE